MENSNLIQPIEIEEERPILITICCILGFLVLPFLLFAVLAPAGRALIIEEFGTSIIPVSIFLILLDVAGLVGYLKMRKWGVYCYATNIVFALGYGLFVGMADIFLGPLNIATPIVGLFYFRKMS